MKMRRVLYLALLLQVITLQAFAQKEYYTSIDGIKGGATLKTALHNLIKDHKQISYGSGSENTWGAFYTTDAVVENGKRRVLDMYSSEKRYFGSKGSAIEGMNIEHSVAKSWWGGGKNNAYCDIHHLNPSDQDANSSKSNYPLGELTSVSWNNGVTFVGKAYIDGDLQNAFEPHDDYKGDFARTYMYMFTCYQDLTWKYTWMNYENSSYPTLKPWAVELLLKWHKQDPVSEKEVNRNNAVHAVQGNRNPFIDYPQLADYVWGDSINYVFHLNGEVEDGSGDNNDDSEQPGAYKLKMFEDFEDGTILFTPINEVGEFPWMFEYQCGEVTSYDDDEVAHNAESWLVSTPLDFSNDSIALLTFDYVIRYCTYDKVIDYNQLLISRNYNGGIADATWEVIDFGATQNTTDWTKTTTEEIVIPKSYMGDSNVVIAFKYIGTEERAGTFEVDNIKLIVAEGKNDGETGSDNTGDGDDEESDDNNDSDNDNEDNAGDNIAYGNYQLATNVAQLSVGDYIIIAYENFVMGAQTDNYRSKVDGLIVENNIVTYIPDGTQEVTLEKGTKEGTFAFNVGDGYLAATSISKNNIATNDSIDNNASWSITIDSEGLAIIEAQGDKTRNTLQYNTSAPRFSCYTGSQKSVNIYVKKIIATGVENIEEEKEKSENIYDLQGRKINEIVEKGIYIIDGRKMIVK